MMAAVGVVSLAMLSVAALLAAWFVVRSRNLVDRAVGLDTAVAVVLNGLAVGVAVAGGGDGVDLILMIGLLAFLGTVTVARFIERRGAGGPTDPGRGDPR